MLAASTRFWDRDREDESGFARRALDLGAAALVLGPEVAEARFAAVVAGTRAAGAEIAALEAVCPHPADLRRHEARPGLLPLCLPDPGERAFAIERHRETIARAADLRIGTVVLHLGEMRVDDSDRIESDAREQGERAVRRALEHRAAHAAAHLDAARRSLDALLPFAERSGVRLAIANPSVLFEMPSVQELGGLFKELDGAPLDFWLEVGGALRLERLGVATLARWLETFGDHLAGAFLEDARDDDGVLEDRLAPGHGSVDFAPLIAATKKRPVLVALSCAPSVDPGRLRDGLESLRKKGLT